MPAAAWCAPLTEDDRLNVLEGLCAGDDELHQRLARRHQVVPGEGEVLTGSEGAGLTASRLKKLKKPS